MDFLNATDPATLTASPQRVFKSRCYFCSSTNSCADHLPTAASTAVRTLNIAQTADSKPPTTAPTTPSRTSSICSPLRDGATSLLESSCLTSRRLESSINLNGAIGRIFQADVLKDQPFTSAAISEGRAEIATAHRNNS